MDELKMLIEDMWEELHDCDKYAKRAFKYKDKNKAMSEAFAQTAREEYTHFERLHEMAIKCINSMRDEHGDIPAYVHTVWDWECEKLLDRAVHVKHTMSMAR